MSASDGDGGTECVGFDDGMFQPVQPLSRDATGGTGRAAWADLRDPVRGQADSFRRHQEMRREAETGSSRLWRVHGKMYDLEPFLDLHPGGRVWLELTRGSDATQAFEAYHLDGPKVQAVLDKYYVRDVKQGEFAHGDRFTYDDNGFFRTLRRRVLERLRSVEGEGASTAASTAATASMRAACALIVAQFAALHGLAAATGSQLAAALAGVTLSGVWGVGHNFMHQAQKKAGLYPYAMDMVGHHAADWRISHSLSHHLDTNLPTDYEYNQFFPLYTSDQGDASFLLAPLLAGPMQLFQSFAYVRNSVYELLSGRGKSIGKHAGHIFPGLLPWLQLLSYVRGRKSLRKGLAMYLLQSTAFFLTFIPQSTAVHHAAPPCESEESEEVLSEPSPRNTYAWMEGQQGAETDFGAHQVAATSDHTVFSANVPAFLRNWLSLVCFGYLNNHTLHHIFPGIDHSRLSLVNDVYQETAKEFGLDPKNVKPVPYSSLYRGAFRYFMSMKRRSRL